jgi:hypothetical protein
VALTRGEETTLKRIAGNRAGDPGPGEQHPGADPARTRGGGDPGRPDRADAGLPVVKQTPRWPQSPTAPPLLHVTSFAPMLGS